MCLLTLTNTLYTSKPAQHRGNYTWYKTFEGWFMSHKVLRSHLKMILGLFLHKWYKDECLWLTWIWLLSLWEHSGVHSLNNKQALQTSEIWPIFSFQPCLSYKNKFCHQSQSAGQQACAHQCSKTWSIWAVSLYKMPLKMTKTTGRQCHVAVSKRPSRTQQCFLSFQPGRASTISMQTGFAAVWEHQRLNSPSVLLLIASTIFTVANAVLMQSKAVFCSPAPTTPALFFHTFSSNYNDDSLPDALTATGGHWGNRSSRRLWLTHRSRDNNNTMFWCWLANWTGVFSKVI